MKKLLFPAIVAMTLFAACGGTDDGQQQPKEVNVLVASLDSCSVFIDVPAQLKGKTDINVIPEVEAVLDEVLVKEGDYVKKGQVMFVLAQTSYRAHLENARANVKVAKAQLGNARVKCDAKKILFDKNIISENEYKVAQNDLENAEAQVAVAEANLMAANYDFQHTMIRAASNGVVGNINYRRGSLVGPAIQKPLTVLSDNSVVYAYMSIAEQDYMELVRSYGSREAILANLPKTNLILSDGTIYESQGKVETFSGVADQGTGAISVRVAYQNPDGILNSGGSANVSFPIVLDSAIIVPRSATFEIQNKTYIYKVHKKGNDYIAETAIVETLRLAEQHYVISGEVEPGDTIVTDGVRKMQNGMPVTPVIKEK
ncbi:MAG: efflux RND transporter periplasmic adaptor subunit [Paludibacteraceae bacterium]|nr:efflux RND transporter periplasmic adaptor subunit [Paludibacteraceae bacterium]